jgi:Ca-activated chloride channel homolog
MKHQTKSYFIAGIVSALALSGCGGAESDGPFDVPGPGATGISQGGAQDFGLFRQILEDGAIPGPETIDDIGFFAEHKLDYPLPTCGEDVCMHGLLGIMGNMISGSTCTLIQIGMNSPIDVSQIQRPDLHLVIAVDVSASMQGPPITYVKAGLVEMISALQPADRISLVKYSSAAQIVLDAVPASNTTALQQAFNSLDASGSTNLYDGLFTAFALADKHYDPTVQNRVLFLSDGVATAGLTSAAKMKSLAEGYARKGIGVTAVGVGTDFDVDVMRDLSEVGAGNFYFLEYPMAVKEVFTDEVKTFLVPVALDVHVNVTVGGGYLVRGAYGTNGWQGSEEGGTVNIPSLFLAGRTSSEAPITTGRRGGGGAILLELVPRSDPSGVLHPYEVGNLSLSWTHPATGATKTEQVTLSAPSTPDSPPADGYFTGDTVAKGFVMLNLYAGFKLAAELAADSDPRTARRTLEALRPNVQAWVSDHPDPDIEDDLRYVDMFLANLKVVEENVQPYTPADPPNPWPAD